MAVCFVMTCKALARVDALPFAVNAVFFRVASARAPAAGREVCWPARERGWRASDGVRRPFLVGLFIVTARGDLAGGLVLSGRFPAMSDGFAIAAGPGGEQGGGACEFLLQGTQLEHAL